jgi:poly-gamma-glutamate synthesis protein (capsule biosynthesis protein)
MKKKKLLAMKLFILFTFTLLILTVTSELILYYGKRQNSLVSDDKPQNNGGILTEPTENEGTDLPEEDINKNNDKISESSALEDGKDTTNKTPASNDTVLVFGGDIYMSDSIINYYKSKGIKGVLSEDLLEEIRQADIAMMNQEFAFSLRGTPMEDKQFTFRIDPKYVNIFKDMEIDIVTLANNHILDFGRDALEDSFSTLENENIKYVGAGRNLGEAKQAEYFEVNNKTIAILGASRVIPVVNWNAGETTSGLLTTYDATILVDEIKMAKANSDTVIVYVHWGIERNTYPEDYQRNLAKQYIEAGADLIVGSHPHVLQGIEYYNGKPIVYSLGNFMFYGTIKQTALLKVIINQENEVSIKLLPCKAANGQTFLQTKPEEIKKFYQEIESISYGISIDENGMIP